MPKFTDVVAIHDDKGKLNIFSPGDDVPAWLRGKVGEHAIAGSWPAERKSAAKSATPAAEAKTAAVQVKEAPKVEDPEGSAEGAPAEQEGDQGEAQGEEDGQEQSTEEEDGAELSFTGDNSDAEDEEPKPVKPTTRTRTAKK